MMPAYTAQYHRRHDSERCPDWIRLCQVLGIQPLNDQTTGSATGHRRAQAALVGGEVAQSCLYKARDKAECLLMEGLPT